MACPCDTPPARTSVCEQTWLRPYQLPSIEYPDRSAARASASRSGCASSSHARAMSRAASRRRGTGRGRPRRHRSFRRRARGRWRSTRRVPPAAGRRRRRIVVTTRGRTPATSCLVPAARRCTAVISAADSVVGIAARDGRWRPRPPSRCRSRGRHRGDDEAGVGHPRRSTMSPARSSTKPSGCRGPRPRHPRRAARWSVALGGEQDVAGGEQVGGVGERAATEPDRPLAVLPGEVPVVGHGPEPIARWVRAQILPRGAVGVPDLSRARS